ncbi:hypothetical protein [Streptomyces sp. NPDC050528]|uniref:hypothetical protein n=1 Tax=Streptomyces sp. NPDC050528 TaxID=3365623 RepID=UPI0037B5E981
MFGVVGRAGTTGVTGVTGMTGMTGGNSADSAGEFGVGVGVDAGIDASVGFGAVEAAAAAPGLATARCTLSVPPPETGAALSRLLGRLSGSVALRPAGSFLLATLPATFPPAL